MKYTDSESNELMIGVLHMMILPFAMFELGAPWILLQIEPTLLADFRSTAHCGMAVCSCVRSQFKLLQLSAL